MSAPQIPPPAIVPTPEQLALCRLTADDFRRLFLDLLPTGWAWQKQPGSTMFAVFDGTAQEPARVAGRDCDLLAESFPCGASELLPDWERVCGLPDECTPDVPATVAARRERVCVQLALQGGQSRAYFIALAASLGLTITITEHFPFMAGQAEAGCAQLGDCRFWWLVTVTGIATTYPAAGCTGAGEPPCGNFAGTLECLFQKWKPAHTTVTFSYPPPTLRQQGVSYANDARS